MVVVVSGLDAIEKCKTRVRMNNNEGTRLSTTLIELKVAWSAAVRFEISVGCNVAMQGLARHQLDGAGVVESVSRDT
jgi:hypothetical protein